MSIEVQLEQAAISSAVNLLGQGDVFTRIVSEIERVNASIPKASGTDKRNRVIADAKIVFDDLVVPMGENVLRCLIEIGVMYLKAGGIV